MCVREKKKSHGVILPHFPACVILYVACHVCMFAGSRSHVRNKPSDQGRNGVNLSADLQEVRK